MKTAKLIELERKRFDLIDEARDALDAIKDNTDEAQTGKLDRKHDEIMRSFDLIELDIRQEEIEAGDEKERQARRPNQGSGETYAADGFSYFPQGKWIDERGNPVRVATRSDSYAERSGHETIGMGDFIRAKVGGARNEAEQRALSEGTDSAGGFTVPTPLSTTFIDRMRAESVAIRAGAMTVPMSSETLAIARLESDPSVDWRAENAAIAEGDPTFSRVLFEAKSCAGIIRVSRELMADTINAGAIIEQAFAEALARKLDFAAIWGTGSSNMPTGVVNTAGINTVSMGTNGAALGSYDPFIDAVYEMHADNAADPTAAIMNPRTLAALAKLKDGDGNPLTVPEMIAAIPRLKTTAAPVDETEGTANDASSVVFGDFTQLMIGLRESVNIRVYDQPFVGNGQIAIVAHLRADVQLAQPKSFSALTGIIPAA